MPEFSIYVGAYDLSEDKTVTPSKPKVLVIYPYVGLSLDFGYRPSYHYRTDRVCLIFEDEEKGFWPAIAWLTPEEAEVLAEHLKFAAKRARKGWKPCDKQLVLEVR